MEIRLEHIADVSVLVAPTKEVGESWRIVPILGGEARGPKIRGTVLPGGADFKSVRKDGVIELTTRYVIRADSGALIYVENLGLRHGPPEVMERLMHGQKVNPDLIYFRTSPHFDTSAPEYEWLTRHLFIGTGVRKPDWVDLSFFQVL